MSQKKSQYRVIAENRRARYDYTIEETMEAGLVLMGTEIKSIRRGHCTLGESHAGLMEGELFLFNAFIPEYLEANRFNHVPKRPRKLLITKRERKKFFGAIKKGKTLVPLRLYLTERGWAKVTLALASGKKQVDKRATEKERDWQRDKARIMRAK